MSQEGRAEDAANPLYEERMAQPSHAPEAVQSLKQAMRRARYDDAERAGVTAEMRAARLGRLEMLQEALRPLIAQIPKDVDLFDVGLMPGANPRLFIDMIGFVEMARDTRVYRLVQDTRHGRVHIAESAEVATMVDACTDYVARRLLERDKAIASDTYGDDVVPERLERGKKDPKPTKARRPAEPGVRAAAERGRRPAFGWAGIAFAFLIDLLGAITFFSILAAICWFLWMHFHGGS